MTRTMRMRAGIALAGILIFAGSAAAGPDLKAVRVAAGPKVDGLLDDPAWAEAGAFADFRMVFPVSGGEPSEKTVLRIVYDEANLYLGILCRDREPGRITANTMAHDKTGFSGGYGGYGHFGASSSAADDQVGLIFTNGSPTGEKNSLIGADFNYGTSGFLGNKNLMLAAWGAYNWNEQKDGPYDYTNVRLNLSTSNRRPVSGSVNYTFGQFYSGHYDDFNLGLDVKIDGFVNLSLDTNLVRGRMPQGTFSENVYQLKADVFLSPDLGFMNYIQYDDVSRNLGWSARLRWRISPGNEIYLVFNKGWERSWDPVSRFLPTEERGVLKLSFSIRP